MRFAPIVLLSIALALSASAADRIAVLHKADDSVGFYDTESGRLVGLATVGNAPHEAVTTPDGSRLVVANYGDSESPGWSLSVIDTETMKVVNSIDLSPSKRPHGLAALNDKEVLVTSEDNRAILRVDIEVGVVRQIIDTGQEVSHMLAYIPRNRQAWVANIGSGTATIIDVSKGRKLTDVRSGKGAEGIAVHPDEREIWITNRAEDTVSVIDIDSRLVVATLECERFPIRIEFTPDGRLALVSNARSGDLAVFDVKTRNLVQRVDLELKASEQEGRLFGSRFGNSSVPVGIEVGVASNGDQIAWVAHSNADLVSAVDLTSLEVIGQISTRSEPDGMAFLPGIRP